MKTKLTNFALGLMLGVSIATAADEPLPSWNEGPLSSPFSPSSRK